MPAGVLPSSVFAPSGLPTNAGLRTRRFEPERALYNVTPANTSRLKTALAHGQANDALASLMFVGDSKTAGWTGTTMLGTRGWPGKLLNLLVSAGYTAAGTGVVFPTQNAGTAHDPRWTLTGFSGGGTNNAFVSATTTGSVATFVSDRPGTNVDIYSFGTSAPFTYSIDGQTPVTVTPTGGGVIYKTSITGLSNSVHTVQIVSTSASSTYVLGVDVYNATGIKFTNHGINSSTANADWSNTAQYYQALQTSKNLPASAVFISLGTNDAQHAASISAYKTGMQTIIPTYTGQSKDVVLVVPTPLQASLATNPTWDQFVAATYDLADQYSLPLIDLTALYHDSNADAQTNGWMYSDGLHELELGYTINASAVFELFEAVHKGLTQPAFTPTTTIDLGPIDVVGDSHISEYGPTLPDHGIVERICGYIKPALQRSCALGGSTHAWANQGNGTTGDGGHFHIVAEFDRQEQSGNAWNSTITQTVAAGVNSITANVGTGGVIAAGQWVTLGTGANIEDIQLSQTWNGSSPLVFATNTTKAHTTGDPVYMAMRNNGYLAKSQLVISCIEGANDLGVTGPGAPPSPLSGSWQQGTFGTTLGASRGNMPFMHTLRFTYAGLRCCVIYKDTHPSCVYGTSPAWTSTPITSTASYPPISSLGGGNAGNIHTSSAFGGQIVITTAPSFPGGTVAVFTRSGAAGQGAIWDYSVSGATTRAMSSNAAGGIYDDRSIGALYQNMSSASGSLTTGSCFRIQNLNPGVNVITLQAGRDAGSFNTTATFLGWGIEAPIPPVIYAICPARVPGVPGTAGPGAAYNVRPTGAVTGTVSLGTPSTVTFSASLTLGTVGSPANTLQINDTITLDKGNPAKEETRRITGFTGSPATTCTVDAPFTQAHTTALMVIGLQDADYVGGGFLNTSDTQGAISVPGLTAVISSVCSEFDSFVIPFKLDPIVNNGVNGAVNPLNFYTDGVHFNDQGSGLIASVLTQAILSFPWTYPMLASRAVTNKRTFQGVYGDAGATPAASSVVQVFANSWTNIFATTFTGATTYPRTHYFRNPFTKEVWIEGAVRGGAVGTTIFTLPPGYRPSSVLPLMAWTISSTNVWTAAGVTVDATGAVKCTSNPPVTTTGAMMFAGNFIAAA